jgi:hypothetical protein
MSRTEPITQDAGTDHGEGGGDDEPDCPHRIGGRLDLVAVPDGLLGEKEPVQVGADWHVIVGKVAGEGGHRVGRHAGRAEQRADDHPLVNEHLDVGVLGGRIARVQLLEGDEVVVGLGQHGGVEPAQELGPQRRVGGEEGLLAGGVGGVHVTGQLAGRSRGGQLIAGDLLPERRGRGGPDEADRGNNGNGQQEHGEPSHRGSFRNLKDGRHLGLLPATANPNAQYEAVLFASTWETAYRREFSRWPADQFRITLYCHSLRYSW